jgi:putative membrane protein
MDPYHYHFIGMHYVWWFVWLMLIIPFFFLATPVRRKTVRLYRENPFGILQRRYAAGEITTEEYEERKSRIERDSRDPKLQPLSPVPLEQDVPA